MDFFKARAIDMRINLRRGNIGMAEHRLNGAQIRTAFEQMGGERMAQGVRCDPFLDSCRQSIAPDHFPKALPAERLAGTIGKNKRTIFAFEQDGSAVTDIAQKFFARPLAERDGPDFRPLSLDGEIVSVEIDVPNLQTNQLRDSQAGSVEQSPAWLDRARPALCWNRVAPKVAEYRRPIGFAAASAVPAGEKSRAGDFPRSVLPFGEKAAIVSSVTTWRAMLRELSPLARSEPTKERISTPFNSRQS